MLRQKKGNNGNNGNNGKNCYTKFFTF